MRELCKLPGAAESGCGRLPLPCSVAYQLGAGREYSQALGGHCCSGMQRGMLLLCVSMIMRLDLDEKNGQNFNASKYGDGWRCGDVQYRDVYVVMHYWPASWLGEARAFR